MSSKTSKKGAPAAKKGPSIGNAIGLVVVVAFCALVLVALFGGDDPESTARPIPATMPPPPPVASPSAAAPMMSTSPAPTRSGSPWEYDAATNHHWDPRPGHQHWHQGPPPPEDQRNAATMSPTITQVDPSAGMPSSTIPATSTPITINPSDGRPERDGQPWEYDAATDFHWDPRPGHQHWHAGQPPPADQRQ